MDMTRESIEWLSANEEIYDTWMIISYAATSCALVQVSRSPRVCDGVLRKFQYHTWARRKDQRCLQTLKLLRDCVQRWEAALSPDSMSTRRKVQSILSDYDEIITRYQTAEIITLLYETAQSNPREDDFERETLGPTPGVVSKLQGSLKDLVFREDKSRPGGGVFVVNKKRMAMGDLPENSVITAGEKESTDGGASNSGHESISKDKENISQSDVNTPTADANGNAGGATDLSQELGNRELLDMWGSGGLASVPATTDGVPYLFPSRTLDVQLQHQTNQAQPYGPQGVFSPHGDQHHQHPGAHPGVHPQHHPQAFHQMGVGHGHGHPMGPHPNSNVNPSMNSIGSTPGVLLMNASDANGYPQGIDATVLNGLASAEQVLEGIPGSMFDWGKSRLPSPRPQMHRNSTCQHPCPFN
jgi:hypothetical protein